ncbi:hypothetical protein POPTR_004G143001v4 [Populus trichocarpa]|uniref:Uncharacterized protein n=1 Tax=Populus trichocarpa TaxID=3694 RepID=A0ACC0T5K0_POPTR|nr:hypothetical protein POPTR_004G143001v4 [Populus trichocarpa]
MGGCYCWISRGWLMIVKMERQLCWCCFGLSVWLGDTRFGCRTAIGGGLGWVSGFSLKRWDGDGGLWWFWKEGQC